MSREPSMLKIFPRVVALVTILATHILPISYAAADTESDTALVRQVAEQFLQAMQAQNIEEAASLAAIPLTLDDHESRVTVEKKERNLRSRLGRACSGQPWSEMKISRILTLEEASKSWTSKIRDQLRKSLQPSDSVVILTGQANTQVDLYLRAGDGKASVIGFSTFYQAE